MSKADYPDQVHVGKMKVGKAKTPKSKAMKMTKGVRKPSKGM